MNRSSGHVKRMKTGGLIATAGTLPLLVYVLAGPKDGNPVGLGLLMWLCWLVGGVMVIWGGAGALGARIRNRRAS